MSAASIVVGIDGSDASNKALEHAMEMATQYQATLIMVHVIDWSPFQFSTLEDNEHKSSQRRQTLQQDREHLMQPLSERMDSAGIAHETLIEFGHPAEVISDMAVQRDALAIVVGRSGQSRLKRVIFGGVASALVHEAKCPVVIVP